MKNCIYKHPQNFTHDLSVYSEHKLSENLCPGHMIINFFSFIRYYFLFYKVVEFKYPDVPTEESPVHKPKKEMETRGTLS